jgi:hypothetical protein
MNDFSGPNETANLIELLPMKIIIIFNWEMLITSC